MARYSGTVTDQNGVALPGALVLVESQVNGDKATLTDAVGSPILNPITSDPLGGYEFYTADGIYDLTYTYRGRTLRQDFGINVGTVPVGPAISQAISSAIAGVNTSVVSEGTNLYFTNSRARSAFSGSSTVSLSNGVLSLTKANVDAAVGFTTSAIAGSATATVAGGVVSLSKANVDTALGFTTYQLAGSATATVNSGVVSLTAANLTAALGATPLTTAGGTLSGGLMLPANPTDPLGAVTKQYVDNLSAGRQPKTAVAAASIANLTLNGTQTVDGVVLAVGNRFLAKDQTDQTKNGIWIVQSAAWTRANDMDAWSEVPNATCVVTGGNTNANTSWICNSTIGGTLETTPITFVLDNAQPNYTATGGITKTSLQFALTPVATDRFLGNVSGSSAAPVALTPSQVKTSLALSNVDNTSDVNKPVSTPQVAALALKASLTGAAFTGAISSGDANNQFALISGNPGWTVSGTSRVLFDRSVSAFNFDISGLTRATLSATALTLVVPISAGRSLTLAGGAAGAITVINANAGTQKAITLQSGGLARWQIEANSEAEAGGDAGSTFAISRFNDAGGYIDTPFSIRRQTGKVVSGANTSWISSIFANIDGVAQIQAASTDGYAAITAFTRASDNPTAFSQGCYAGGFFGYANDAAADSPDTYAIYAEGARASGAGTLSTVEFAARNNGTTVLCSPYQSNGAGVTTIVRLSNLSGSDISAAILIFGGLSDGGGNPVGAQFARGIVFKHGAVTTGVVLDMAAEHRLLWGNAGTALAEINATQVGTSAYKFQEVWAVKYGIGGVLKTLSVDGSGFVKAA